MIYLVEDGNTYTMEQAEYPVTQLWSDIGGAAGKYFKNTLLIKCVSGEQCTFYSSKIILENFLILGLMLGISFATLIGVVDCLCSFLFVLVAKGTQAIILIFN